MDVTTIFGPPGTGKTYILMEIMEYEVRKNGVHPSEIAFLTFTKNAKQVALSRVWDAFSLTPKEVPYFGTLHSACFRLLGLSREFILRGVEDLSAFGQKYGVEFSEPRRNRVLDLDGDFVPMGGNESGDRLLEMDHLLRQRKQELTRRGLYLDFEDVDYYEARRFREIYRRYKDQEGLYDFTDLLGKVSGELPVRVVFVDEAQDLSELQWDTLFKIIPNAERVYAAGDDDQSIFVWAGASPQRFINLSGHSRVLRHSHRLPSKVHAFATKVSSTIRNRKAKEFNPCERQGTLKWVRDEEELDPKHGENWLILARNHYLTGSISVRLRDQGVPFSVSGTSAVPRDLAHLIECWELLRRGKHLLWHDAVALVNRLHVGHGVLGPNTRAQARLLPEDRMYDMADLNAIGLTGGSLPWTEVISGIGHTEKVYLEKIRKNYGSLNAPETIRVSTIHAAKGAEATNVALLGEVSRKVIQSQERDPDSETRVMYVGATRAVENLILVGESELLSRIWKA